MRQIALHGMHGVGKFALVDDEDYEELNKHKWLVQKKPGTCYVCRYESGSGKTSLIFMHRQIMSPPDDMQIDHINHNGLDNRRCNLRICTQAENMRNSVKQKTARGGCPSSIYRGVSWNSGRGKKWKVGIKTGDVQIHLGYFNDEIEAAHAYDAAAIEYHGEFAHPNFPELSALTV